MDQNILYIGVELDSESQRILKEKFGKRDGWKLCCHHMTVMFNTGPECELTGTEKVWFERNSGATIFLIVSHYGENEKVAAVRIMTNAPTRNKLKHITLGINLKTGGKLKDADYIKTWKLTEPIILTGHTKIWYKTK